MFGSPADLRDYFAAKALSSFELPAGYHLHEVDIDTVEAIWIARNAYVIADAMLVARATVKPSTAQPPTP